MSDDSRGRAATVRELAAVSAFFALLSVAWTFPLVLRLRTHIASDAGDPLLVAWILGWDADRIRHGFAGIWDAPTFFPYHHTLLYSEHFLGVAIFTAPLQSLTGNPILVYNVAFLASQILSGLGMYVLARWLTQRRDAAFVAALVFACQPFRASHSSHLQLLVLGWLPLSVWALHRYFHTARLLDLIGCAVFYLLQALTNGYLAFYGLLPLACVAAYELWKTRSFPVRLLGHSAVAGALAIALMAPVIRTYEEVRSTTGFHWSREEIAGNSADVGDYSSASTSLYLWGGMGNGRGEHELFPGFAAILLAALAIATARNSNHGQRIALYGVLLAVALVLSFGPSPTAFGHPLGISAPYAWLLRIVPGLDGLRAPARLAVVVQLALAVLAGFGAVHVLDFAWCRSTRARGAIFVMLALFVGAEGAAALGSTPFDYRGKQRDRDAYAYLKSLPSGAAIELPTRAEHWMQEFEYQYMTLRHAHRIVNGQSGYMTPLAEWLRGGHSPLHEPGRQRDAVEMLRSIGVRYLVIHDEANDDPAVRDELMRALEDPSQAISRRAFESMTVAALAPFATAPPLGQTTPITAASIVARASDSNDRLALLFDGDRDTRWLTGRPQSGDEWLELTFDRPRDVRALRFQLGTRSFGDYPRQLTIEAVEASGVRDLFVGSVLPQFARGILSDGEYPWIEVTLPANVSTSLRLRQTAQAHTFFWSIHELQVFEASGRTP